ncbi:MAG TPA: phage recombination protein Bet [Candidatus Aminicenantes bacterium]|nr:phage recombination protein Bet [Candidatus Aminicenantes bacterium]
MTKAAKAPSTALVKAVDDAAVIPLTKDNIVKLVNPHASPQEVALFLNVCAMYGLNPFKREIYLIKYDPKEKASFVVGYESYLKRAERTDKWAGMATGTVDDPKTGVPIKAWAKIWRKDWPQPLEHEVYYSEYVQHGKGRDGKPYVTKFWRKKPRTMLKKVAIAQAMRMAFPDELGGMPYTAEEMPVQHETLPKGPVEVVETKRQAEKESKKGSAGTAGKPGATAPPPRAPAPADSDEDDDPGPEPEDDPGEEIADMTDGPEPELTPEQKKAHRANIEMVKRVLEEKALDYKDFKKWLFELQRLPKNRGKGVFVRDKFGNLSMEAGDPDAVFRALQNIGKLIDMYVASRMDQEKKEKRGGRRGKGKKD